VKCKKCLIVLLFGVLAGCQQQTNQTALQHREEIPQGHDNISYVSLIVESPLLDEDNDKIFDGVPIKLYFYLADQKRPVPGKGEIKIYLVKRTKNKTGRFDDNELYTWTVTPEQLARSVTRDRFGLLCHQMAIYWVGVSPKGIGNYLRAEFIRGDKKTLRTKPIPVPFPINPK
jgi:hypothetical protein